MRGIVVTGASSGIGRATALRFLEAGWRVGLIARRAEALEEIAGRHGAAVPLPCDVTDAAALDAAMDGFAGAGRLGAVFANAGGGLGAALPDEVSPEEFRRVIDVNVTGVFLTARAAFRIMRAQSPQGGRIILNGSLSAHSPRPGSIAYTASKHAVSGLTKTLALDGRPFGIDAGQIDVGNAATAITERMREGVRQADGAVRPEPLMDVGIVADAVLHMASLPEGANVLSMTVMASAAPFVGRG